MCNNSLLLPKFQKNLNCVDKFFDLENSRPECRCLFLVLAYVNIISVVLKYVLFRHQIPELLYVRLHAAAHVAAKDDLAIKAHPQIVHCNRKILQIFIPYLGLLLPSL